MSRLQLTNPPPAYSQQAQTQTNAALERADAQNLKIGDDIDLKQGRFYLHSPNGNRWLITISNSGVLTTTAA